MCGAPFRFQHPDWDFEEQTPSSHALMVQLGLGAGRDESAASSSELSEAFHVFYSPTSDFHHPASLRERGA